MMKFNKKIMVYEYKSKLGTYISGLVEEKRACGFLYNNEAKFLRQFDEFIIEQGLDTGLLDEAVIKAWCEIKASECLNTRNYRADALRMLCGYMQSLGVKTATVPQFRKEPRPMRCVPTLDEMRKFFAFVDSRSPRLEIRDKRYLMRSSVIYRLYCATGLRLSEGVGLRWEDLDEQSGRLLIRYSKGDKQRVIYLDESMLELLGRYHAAMRKTGMGTDEWLFPSYDLPGMHVTSAMVSNKFYELWQQMDTEGFNKDWHPTVHSLRHFYIMTRLSSWYEAGVDVRAMLPYLSAHLGHESIDETYWYIRSNEHMMPVFRRFINDVSVCLSKEVYRHGSLK